MNGHPKRVALPETTRVPRVGKIRLGEQVETTRQDGTTAIYPRALGHFTAREDDSGITSAEAAAAFHAVYGEHPTEIAVILPGQRADDVLEGAYRLYGTGGKLKRRCNGELCDVLSATGGREVDVPCQCKALPETVPGRGAQRGKQVPNPERCTLRWTLNVMLPHVAGVGVWQIDTGSTMAVEGLTASLRMLEDLQGTLLRTEAILRLIQRKVSPEGTVKTVHVLDLQVRSLTPMQAIDGMAQRRELPPGVVVPEAAQLPPSSLDEHRDTLIDPTPEAVEAAAAAETPAEQPAAPAPAGEKSAETLALEARARAVKAILDGLPTREADLLADQIVAVVGRRSLKLLASRLGDSDVITEDGLRAALARLAGDSTPGLPDEDPPAPRPTAQTNADGGTGAPLPFGEAQTTIDGAASAPYAQGAPS